MATADWSREPVVTPPATFTLTLNEVEIKTLIGALASVTGRPFGEDAAYDVYRAAKDALVASGFPESDTYGLSKHITHSRVLR